MSDLMPRWEHVERRLTDHIGYDNERYARIEGKVTGIDEKVDTLQSWADNLSGRLVVLGVLIAFVGPGVVGLILRLV